VTTSTVTLADHLAANRPLNWDDMGSSERDLWEERAERAFNRSRKAEQPKVLVAEIPVGARVKYEEDETHFSVGDVLEVHAAGPHFDLFNKYTGYSSVGAEAILEVLVSVETGLPITDLMAGATFEWVKVAA